MKQIKKAIFVLCIFCGILFLNPQTVQAKQLIESKSYAIDLDGDGKKETVKFVKKIFGEFAEGLAISIYINGKKAASQSMSEDMLGGGVSTIDIKKSDNYKELYIDFTVGMDFFVRGVGYRYKNGTLKKLFTLSRRDVSGDSLRIMDKQPGNGLVYFEEEFRDQYINQGFVKTAYKISSGKLKRVKKSVMSTTNDWRKENYKATISLKAYRGIDEKSAAFTLSEGDIFHIYKVKFMKPGDTHSGISYLYIKTTDGKKGWIKNPQKKFWLGGSEETGWSEDAYAFG